MNCVVCKSAKAQHVCGGCELVAYCSIGCADIDWDKFHRSEHDVNIADMVLAGSEGEGDVWIGGIQALKTAEIMNEIDAVVTAIHFDRVAECAADVYYGNRPHVRISIWDEPTKETALEFASHFSEVGAFIDLHIRQGHNVLVHCAAGFSRSVTLVMYYMLHYRGYKSVKHALKKIRETRPSVNPNKAFRWILSETID